MTILTQWILGAILAAILLKLLVIWLQPRLAFYSVPGPTVAPPPFSAFTVTTSDGVRLSGWTTSLTGQRPVLLYFCGNAGNLADRLDLLTLMASRPCDIVAFNYRGTGESQGRPTEKGIYRDADAIYDYLIRERGINPDRLVFWGHSIGGAVAVELATRRPCAGLVLESAFRSARVMASRMMPLLPVGPFLSYRFDNEGNIGSLQCPVLLIHGTLDNIIPMADSERLHALAKSKRKELWLVNGAGHNDIYEIAGNAFFDRLNSFAAEAACGQRAP
jgi:fermentation-respiration switch protein FrsA (DUF1100 family)